MYRQLTSEPNFDVFGTLRSGKQVTIFPQERTCRVLFDVDVENTDSLIRTFSIVQPDVVINCIGLVKQLDVANDPLKALPINALLPHRLSLLCGANNARFIHISTDCVFSGSKGQYVETDFADADDLYGRSKFLGEVSDPHAITLRTSIIGHEISGNRSLLNWFLSQTGEVKGFTKAIFSGLPTIELASIIKNIVLAKPELSGLYHVASAAINKYDLLHLIAKQYNKAIEIIPSNELVIDRSLVASRFSDATGYVAPAWPELVRRMHADFQSTRIKNV